MYTSGLKTHDQHKGRKIELMDSLKALKKKKNIVTKQVLGLVFSTLNHCQPLSDCFISFVLDSIPLQQKSTENSLLTLKSAAENLHGDR